MIFRPLFHQALTGLFHELIIIFDLLIPCHTDVNV